jgi:FKBP-type peptidyl-prolyl cis-trans isomerase
MARKRDRVFALVMAAAFLITTVGVSASVIWQIMQDNKEAKTAETQASTNNNDTKKIQGTKMENFTPVASVEKLEINDLKPGSGAEVKAGDTVTVDYTGAVAATGTVFQSSLDTGEPVSFGLDQVITGWKDGLVGMKEGGTRRLLIPAEQAYGANPPSGSGIPANAALVFDVTLHKIGQ